jgi:hypothetical protein
MLYLHTYVNIKTKKGYHLTDIKIYSKCINVRGNLSIFSINDSCFIYDWRSDKVIRRQCIGRYFYFNKQRLTLLKIFIKIKKK